MDLKESLVAGLNQDLAGEYAAVIQYNYYATTVTGLNYQILKPFFEAEIPDELGHAAYLSEKIASLGGNPTTLPALVERTGDTRAMLEGAIKSESATLENYRIRRSQAQDLDMIELVVKLEDMISDEQNHLEKLTRILHDPVFS